MNQSISTDIRIFAPTDYTPAMGYCFDIPQSNGWGIYFNVAVYERDWINSKKHIFTSTRFASNALGYETKDYKVKRRFHNDYYYFHPSTNTSYNFRQRHPANGSTFTAYDNGTITLQRTNL